MNGKDKNQNELKNNYKIMLKKTFFYIKKYFYIILPLTILSLFLVQQFLSSKFVTSYMVKALMKIELVNNSAMERRGREVNPLVFTGLLSSRSFLTKVVDSLRLQILMADRDYLRDDLIKKIEYDDKGQYGLYEIKHQKNKWAVFYTNKNLHTDDQEIPVISQRTEEGLLLMFNDINIVLDTSYANREKFLFKIYFVSKNKAAQFLQENLFPRLQANGEYLEINFRSEDPKLATAITNTVAEFLIEESIHLKTFKTTVLLKNLEAQLKVAEKKLRDAEAALEAFRRKNPTVVLGGTAVDELDQINQSEAQIAHLEELLERTKVNLNRLTNEKEINNKNLIANEILNALVAEGFAEAATFSQNLTTEYQSLEELRGRLPDQHPDVIRETSVFNNLIEEIIRYTRTAISKLNTQIANSRGTIQKVEKRLKRLPAKELELARLTREKDLAEQSYTNVKQRYNDAKLDNAVESPDIFLIDKAYVPDSDKGIQKLILKVVFSLAIILFLPLGMGMVFNYIDPTIVYEEEIKDKYSNIEIFTVPIINKFEKIPENIQEIKQRKIDPKLTTIDYSPTIFNEAFRSLRSAVLNLVGDIDEEGRIIAFNSHSSGEGKSLIAGNLAITFAQNKIPTVLIDADLRRGVLHNMFVKMKSPGLSNILAKNIEFSDDLLNVVVQDTTVPNLYIIPSGDPVPNPSEILSSARYLQLLEILKEKYGMIIIDTSPIGLVSDALGVVKMLDLSILVTLIGRSKITHIDELINLLNKANPELKQMIVLNGVKSNNLKSNSYSYYKY